MHRIVIAAAALAILTAPCFAGEEVMANYFGNTVVSSGSFGVSRMHYKPDHTFDVSLHVLGIRHGTTGTWKFDDKGQLCRFYGEVPPGMPNPLCTPWQSHKIGDSWTMAFNGSSRSISLVKGIE